MFKARRLDVFYYNPYWIEEICDTPAEILASRDHTDACFDVAWQAVGGKGAYFRNHWNVFLVLRNRQIDYIKIV